MPDVLLSSASSSPPVATTLRPSRSGAKPARRADLRGGLGGSGAAVVAGVAADACVDGGGGGVDELWSTALPLVTAGCDESGPEDVTTPLLLTPNCVTIE